MSKYRMNGPINVLFEGPFLGPWAFILGTMIVLSADHEGPLGSPIPEFCTTMAKTVFRKHIKALIFSAISGP